MSAKRYTVASKNLMGAVLLMMACGITASLSHAAFPASLPNGVAAGDATANSVVLWTRSTIAGPVKFRYWAVRSPQKIQTAIVRSDGNTPVKLVVTGLQAGQRYRYQVTDAQGHQANGKFNTPHAPSNRHGLRFGVSGDSRGDNRPYYAMQNIPARKLDFVVNLGDTVYADVPSDALPGIAQAQTLAEFQTKHAEIYSEKDGINAMAAARASTLFYSTIDDHEITNDFAGGASPASDARFAHDTASPFINETTLFRNGIQAFFDYQPIQETYYDRVGDAQTDGKPRFYRYQTFGRDAAIFITDARSFRDQALAQPQVGDKSDIARFRREAFLPNRSLLGQRQLAQLLSDLNDAEQRGITWKFVLIPEPIQNLTYALAADRYEGYASERAQLLQAIHTQAIHNVVFIAADIHGTVVNNLSYQHTPDGAQMATQAFEVTAGPWSYDAPLAPTAVKAAKESGLLSTAQWLLYQSLPTAAKERLLASFVNEQLAAEGFDAVGLDDSPINVRLLRGAYTATHSYGWTEFAIDRHKQQLTVTTYGTEPGKRQSPKIVSQFRVQPN